MARLAPKLSDVMKTLVQVRVAKNAQILRISIFKEKPFLLLFHVKYVSYLLVFIQLRGVGVDGVYGELAP